MRYTLVHEQKAWRVCVDSCTFHITYRLATCVGAHVTMAILVTKADGTTEEFDSTKLYSSLHRVGAQKKVITQIEAEIEKELYNGISTSEIYRRAFAHLRDHKHGIAARYSLKRAVLDFGSSGFPFEAFIAELYRTQGYTAKIDQIIQGACVEHEVDVVLKKNNKFTYVEAKFHNTAGFKTDLKTTLYVKARMDDIRAVSPYEYVKGLLITNTKFTSKAIQYATCEGLELIAWEYPTKGNLHDLIDESGLYPVTALTTLSKREKVALLLDKKVLCSSLAEGDDALKRVGIVGKRADLVLEEVGSLCVPKKDI